MISPQVRMVMDHVAALYERRTISPQVRMVMGHVAALYERRIWP